MCDRTVYFLTGVVERKLSLMLVRRKISETLLPARCISLPLTFIPILLRSSVLCLSSLPILRTHAKRNTNSIIRNSPLLLVPCFYKCFSLRLLLSLPWSKMSRGGGEGENKWLEWEMEMEMELEIVFSLLFIRYAIVFFSSVPVLIYISTLSLKLYFNVSELSAHIFCNRTTWLSG